MTGAKNGERELIPVAGVPGVRGLTIAADGRRLTFAGLALSSQIWAQPVRSDGTVADAAIALTNDTSRRNSLPVVSPDGSKIAYLSTRSGQSSDVWVMGVDGREPVQFTADEGAESKPGWFPDSRRVAFMSSRKNVSGLFAVDVFTRREEQFFDFTRTRHQPNRNYPKGWFAEFDLAPSVNRTAFSVIPSSGRRVMYVSDLDAFSPRAVSDGSVSVGYPSWSPDERQLAVRDQGRQLDPGRGHRCHDRSASALDQRARSHLGEQLVSEWATRGSCVAQGWTLAVGGDRRSNRPPGDRDTARTSPCVRPLSRMVSARQRGRLRARRAAGKYLDAGDQVNGLRASVLLRLVITTPPLSGSGVGRSTHRPPE